MKPPIPPDLSWRGFFGREPPAREPMLRWAIGLFLVSLSALFIATLIGYTWTRLTGPGADQPVELPRGLWLSTVVLLLCGVAIGLAQRAAKAGSIKSVRLWLPIAWLLSIAFLAVQGPSVVQLIESHQLSLSQGLNRAEGLVFTLIILHALHVLGGLVPLTILLARSLRRRLTSDHLGAIRACAAYWHFLEAVWVVMFTTLLILK